MTKRVYKYELLPNRMNPELCTVSMPAGAEVLSAHGQFDNICIWALVDADPSLPEQERAFVVVGTGRDIPVPALGRFLGTALLERGSLVFHVFEAA